jgi:hypothetical protein
MPTSVNDYSINVFDNEVKDIVLPAYSVGDLLTIFISGTNFDSISFSLGWAYITSGYGYIKIADGSEGSSISAADYNSGSTSFTGTILAMSWSPSSGYQWDSWSSAALGSVASYYGPGGGPVEITGSDGFDPAAIVNHLLWAWVYDESSLGADPGAPFLTWAGFSGSPSPTEYLNARTGDIGLGNQDLAFAVGDVFDLPGDNGAWTFDAEWTFSGAVSGGPTAYHMGIAALEIVAPTDDFATNGAAGYWG